MFLSVLRKDDLGLREIDVWDCIVRWGMRQIKEIESGQLEKENILKWSQDGLEELKDMLDSVIPLIRFNQITPIEFYKEIEPYKKIIDKELYNEIVQIYLSSNDDNS